MAQSGCPGCVIDLPPLPSDTIYLGNAPDGVAGEAYDGDLSFRMPKTTDAVPGTPGGLNIGKITIQSLLNVPPGLDWESNKTEFDPGDETDGCVKFCGTPVLPGLYEVQVFVTATVLGINESTSFTFDFYIAPATSTTDGFTLLNNSGCGELTASFENNVVSNGQYGFFYYWDFGNGEMSTEENPMPVNYTEPGIYEINYEATIDTSGYELTTVQVLAAGCNDLNLPPISNAPPELYIKIKDPTGTQIFQSDEINNAPFPSAFNVNLKMGPGNYSIEVRDNDLIGSDHCGTITFNRNSTDTLVLGNLQLKMDIFHPIFSIQSTDTVYVYEVPEPPLITPSGLLEICEGDTLMLTADYTENLQWYKDSSAILDAVEPNLTISSNGTYWVEYTTLEGCSSVSEPVTLSNLPLPVSPAFSEEGNWLEVNDTSLLPLEYSLQWYVNGDLIPDANETTWCNTIPGVSLYSLVVTDEQTGCTSEYSLGIAYDENADCTVPTKEILAIENSLRLYPNPTSGLLNITFKNEKYQQFEMSIVDVIGRTVYTQGVPSTSVHFYEIIDLGNLDAGVYFLKIQTEEGQVVRKLVKD
ncbi:MAG: T9SS type A sorting domain-containing protein [Bacteroidota bacterium]